MSDNSEKCKCCLPNEVKEVKEKKKRVLSEAQLAVLAKGREKRLELLKAKKEAKVESKVEVKEEVNVEEKAKAVPTEPTKSVPIDIPAVSKTKAKKMIVKPYNQKPMGVRFLQGSHTVSF